MDTNEQVDIAEGEEKDISFSEAELNDETTDWKAKALELQGIAKRRNTQLRKLREARKAVENIAKIEEKAKAPEKKEDNEPTDLDYSQKAFLLAKGIEEFDLVLEEAKKFGSGLKNLKLEDLISNPYFKQRLEESRTTKANADAIDIKGNRTGINTGRNTPEYWMARLKPDEPIPAEIPRDVAKKVVAMRMQQGKDSKVFYND